MKQLSLLGDERGSLPKTVTVQGTDGVFYQVDLKALRCSCGKNSKSPCDHLKIATDIYLNGGKRFRYNIMSAAHKEIRRGDQQRAYKWAMIFARINKKGIQRVADYCQSICFEESRSLLYFKQSLTGELSTRDQIRNMVRLRKKWSLDYMKEHTRDWIQGFYLYNKTKDQWTQKHLRSRLAKYSDLIEGYCLIFVWRANRSLTPIFIEEFEKRASLEKNYRLLDFLKFKPESHYGLMVASELALGHWSEEAEELAPLEKMDGYYIPRFENYIYDSHNFEGVRRLRRVWPIQPGKPPPQGVDIRWSGQMAGIVWRFECYRQHGFLCAHQSGEEIQWENVQIDDEVYRRCIELDEYFYPKFYARKTKK